MRRRSGTGPTKTRRGKPAVVGCLGKAASRQRHHADNDPNKTIDRLRRELEEALQQQTATSEVLSIIRRSPADAQPVFDAIVQSAARLCGAIFGAVYLCDDDRLRIAATKNNTPEAARQLHEVQQLKRPERSNLGGRAILDRAIVHVPDVLADPEYSRELALAGGWRAVLAVPLLREGKPVGALTVAKAEPTPFSARQIQLLNTFADQALIAIDNVRLFEAEQQRKRELSEALEQQTATSEVLRVISSSSGELEPVFNAMLENAVRICQAKFGVMHRFVGEEFYAVAQLNLPQALDEFLRKRGQAKAIPGSDMDNLYKSKQVVHTIDMLATPVPSPPARLAGGRTQLAVPMIMEGELIGAIVIYRQEVRPFTDKQIELVQNFAAQAVIAIENTRLLKALRQRTEDLSESLEQQTATSEVLQVISRSPGELEPVFSTMLANATRICEARFGTLWVREDNAFRAVATHNVPAAFAELRRREPLVHPRPGSVMAKLISGKEVVESIDITTEKAYRDGDPALVALAEIANVRTLLGVPLLKDNEVIGAIGIYRQDVRPSTDKQIELVKNFAAQAVIAIENTRLLSELRESLQQQTATSDVLKVISRSTFDLQTVLNTLTESAALLCEADMATIARQKGDAYHYATVYKFPPDLEEYLKSVPHRPGRGSIIGRTLLEGKVIHLHDVLADPEYRMGEVQKKAGFRTGLGVPLLREGVPIGVINLLRRAVRPFTDKQIELVTTFADQAVIAIENVRLFDEVQARTRDLTESLEQQTATSEVLKVISSSPGELKPVFQAMLENAVRICEAKFGVLQLYEGDGFRAVALHDVPPAYTERRRDSVLRPGPEHPLGRVVRTKHTIHIADILAEPQVARGGLAELAGARTILNVPMLKENELIGVISIYRQEVRPFTDKQIELVSNFAAQAVIAIENTRLLNELRQRTDDLSESLEQQTATTGVLKTISSSPGELEPVFDAILENAVRICGAKFGSLVLFEGNAYRRVALHNGPPAYVEARARDPVRPLAASPTLCRVAATKQVVQVVDMAAEQPEEGIVRLGGARTVLAVPMLNDDRVVGVISIYRQEVRPFTDKQTELVKNFAAQAVIAIENARLLNELRESLQQQTATADVLKVISRSTFDLQTVLDTLVESAARLCEADQSFLFRHHGENYVWAASHGFSQEFVNFRRNRPLTPDAGSAVGRAVLEGKIVHIPDVFEDTEYTNWESQEIAGFRAVLGVPLLREGVSMGVLALTRSEPRSFTDRQIEVLTTFADQAAIAIENVRLFESVEARTRELAASLEDLRATQDRLVQTQKLASLGQLTAGIAHEIKNPLNFVNNFSAVSVELIDELRQALTGVHLDSKLRAEISEIADTLQGNLDKVVQHGKRADAIVKNMLLHSREGSGEHRLIDINALVEESLNLAYHGARAEKQGFNITLQRSLDPAAGEVDVFPQDITRVLLNLISNGFYAATKRRAETNGGDYEPTLTAGTRSLGDLVEITIWDNGTGIPPEVKDKLFNPFFTTKPAGEGTGLGLSISHDIIVKQHGGSIEVDTLPGAFTEFRIILPRTAATIAKSGERP